MQIRNFFLGSALLILTGCQQSLLHDSIPTITRTGEVKDVVIHDTVSPTSVMARPGDEIRWVNKRQADIQVTVISSTNEQPICRRNFKQTMGADGNEYIANVERNDTAGVCFGDPIELKYEVRTESSDSSGEHDFLGTVMIATEEQPSPSMHTSETVSLTKDEPS